MFGLLTVEDAAFFGYSIATLAVSGLVGFTLGFYSIREVIRGIEKNGEFRREQKPFILIVLLAAVLISLVIIGVPLGILPKTIIFSVIAFAPAAFLTRFVFSWRWENRNNKEIQSEGEWRATLYATPKGLTADEKLRIRWDIQQRRSQRPA